ncbi:transcription elongation regulator [Mortierella sp. AM989]|nr:transcription elongation regulator [Mortierella sp. AM989]
MNPIPGGPPGPPYFNNGHLGGPPAGAFGPPQPPPPQFIHPNMLPPGWTEHKAPDGMSYYYNAASGKSSWVRPTLQMPLPGPGGAPIPPPPGVSQPIATPFQQPPPGVPGFPMNQQPLYPPGVAPPPNPTAAIAGGAVEATATTGDVTGKGKKPKKIKKEKAIKKTQVMETPWFIVVTNLENTFFYNKETKASIWVPTPELEQILAKMGQVETEKLEAERKAKEAEEQERIQALKRPGDQEGGQEGDKRAKKDGDSAMDGTEMTEDDVAWQLAAMEGMIDEEDQDQHMQSQEEDDDDEDDEAVKRRLRMLQGSSPSAPPPSGVAPSVKLDITPDNIQEREMAFLDMMRERGVSQFDIWEKAMAKIERDPRMYLIPDKKERQALFESFCVIRAREIKEAKEKESEKKEEKEERDRGDKEKRLSRDSKSHSASTSSSSKPEDVYRRLVEEYTTKTSTWLDFMTKYRVDPRFLGLKPGSLRESIFRQYLSDLKKGIIKQSTRSRSSEREHKQSSSSSRSSSSKKYKATESEIEEFMSLLRETKKDILHEHKHSSSVEWRKIKKNIDRDRRYDAVGSSTERELLFREYADRVIQRRD